MHFMYHAGEGYLAATNEVMYLHVNLESRRTATIPDRTRDFLRRMEEAHANLPYPPQAGRRIELRSS